MNASNIWTELCNFDQFHPFSGKALSHCFYQISLQLPLYTLLAILSAFYLGAKPFREINPSQEHLVICVRVFATIFLLLCHVITLILLLCLHLSASLAEGVSSVVAVLSLTIHSCYIWTLRSRIQFSLRGATWVLIVWCFIVISTVIHCYSEAVLITGPNVKSLKAIRLWSTIFQLMFHIIYLFTLVPTGSVVSENNVVTANETSPLISRQHTQNLGCGEDCNFLSKLLFIWVQPLMSMGARNQLCDPEVVFHMPRGLKTTHVEEKFLSIINWLKLKYNCESPETLSSPCREEAVVIEQTRVSNPVSLLSALHVTFGQEYYIVGLLKLISSLSSFAGPLLLNALVSYIENSHEPSVHGYYYAAGMFLTTLIGALCNAQFNYLIAKVGLKIRAALISMVYNKSLSVTSSTLSTFSTGEIVNFMSVDTDRIVNICPSFHSLWSLPLQVLTRLRL